MQDKLKEILEKGLNQNYSNPDRQEMLALFYDQDSEYELKKELYDRLQKTEAVELDEELVERLLKEMWLKLQKKEQKPIKRVLVPIVRIAAVLVIGLFIGILFNDFGKEEIPVYYSANCPKGSVTSLVMPDSTIIYLNADSEIKYSMNGLDGMRQVYLNGEAWFDVTQNQENPFVVHTSTYDVKVTGTQFNVKAYQSEKFVSTTLEEGEVKIVAAEQFALEDEITLKPGEQAVFDKVRKVVVIKDVDTERFTSWKDNKLMFMDMQFNELITLLERKYGVEMLVKDKELLKLHFNGVLKNETILEVMEILKVTLDVNYEVIDQKIEITARE